MKRRLLVGLALATAIAAVLGDARAADTSAQPSAEAGRLEEVIVTAQRRAESAQDIGISLSVLSEQALKDGAVEKVNGLQNVTPSLEVEPAFGSGQPQFRLRGVGFIDYTSNNTSPVGITVDDVALPFPIQTQGELFDLSRVEVLRGPQGTLYGRNTTGGAVNFIINQPTAETHAGFSVDYGSFNALNAEGFVSGTLAENLLGRLSLGTEQGGSWQWNRATGDTLGNKDKVSGRAQLEWNPSAGTSLRLTLHSSLDKSDDYGMQLLAPFTPSCKCGPIIPPDTDPYVAGWSVLTAPFAKEIGLAQNSKPGVDNTNNGLDLNATFDLGAVKLTSITSADRFIRHELDSWDATQYTESVIFFHDDVKVFSEEVRLASTGTGPFSWVSGVYYENDKLTEYFYGDFTQRLGGYALTNYTQTGSSEGIFGQASYQFTDRLKGILGLRPDRETRNMEGLESAFTTSTFSGLFSGPSSSSLTNNSLSGKAELDFEMQKGALLYGSISRGVKSGGFTAHNGSVAVPFQPETLLAYELGLKADIASVFRVNAALFYYDYTDEQVLSKYFDPVSQSYIGSFINAPKSRIDGGEVELEWTPGNGFELTQYFGYKEGKFTAPVFNSSLVNFDGKDIDFPKLSYGGQVAYAWPVGNFKLRAETNYSYHDKYDQLFLLENVNANAQVIGPPQFQIDAYWLANASIALSPAVGRSWSFSFWAHNITDQKYYITKNFFLPATNIGAAGEPTTVGVRLDWSF
ncbi:MAG TPA: TonB-dependent receptor [Candidatus Acidoferrales bacterium]|nr:TonB-dependent receptor [Candidatus Acidoferrales bacterium]